MGRVHEAITDELAAFMAAQPVFFVATAPLAGDGHVNVSPKGLDTLRLLDPHTVAYVDLDGSGIETIAHLRENGRITLMFCAFEGKPKVLRLHGRGEVFPLGSDTFDALAPRMPAHDFVRSMIRVHVQRVSSTCGYGVPLMRLEGPRAELHEWAAAKGAEGLAEYRARKNARSIDGLPGW